MKKMILYIMSAMILLSMQQSDINWVDVRPVKSNASVILKANRSKSKILMIQFPLAFKVCNLSSEKVSLYYHSYYINHTDKSRIGKYEHHLKDPLLFRTFFKKGCQEHTRQDEKHIHPHGDQEDRDHGIHGHKAARVQRP